LCWGNPQSSTILTLTQLAGPRKVDIDRGSESYVQLACSTTDVYKTEVDVRAQGGTVLRAAGPVPGIGTVVAKIADPDGWVIAFVDNADFLKELCAVGSAPEDVCNPSSNATALLKT
jgi:hypothetical protein